MDTKKEFRNLVASIKNAAIQRGENIRNEDIAKKMGYSREHLSSLMGPKGTITSYHITLLKMLFQDELELSKRPAPPGDFMNRERALIKMLMHRLAKAEAKLYNRPLEDVLKEMDADTTLYLNDLERE